MKTNIKIFALLLILCVGAGITPQKASAQGASVSFQVFYDDLSPYGTWVDNPDYGYVWVPDVAPGFTPYATNGHWIMTDEGWTWVSNYPWGWAPFHYGRWYTDPNYGPIWVPDNEWGPGWVTWRRSGDYYGWAPIGPGVSINVAYSNSYDVPYNQWTFVRGRDFGRRDINNYYVNNSNNVTIINNSTVINNTRIDRSHNVTYNAGPERAEVEKRAGRKFTPVAIKETSKPGQNLSNNQLQIYRPQVQKTVSAGMKPAPTKVASLKEVKPPAQRTGTPAQKVNQQQGKSPQNSKVVKQPQQNVQPAKQQPPQEKRNVQPAKQQQTQPTKQQQTQPAKQQQTQPTKQQQTQPTKQQQTQPAKQQQPPPQQQRNVQPAKQQQTQPVKQQQTQPTKQQQTQPTKQQQPPQQQQRNTQPAKQQQQPPQQQQRNTQPAKQQQQPPQQQQRNTQPAKQQQPPQQQQRNAQPTKQQQTQPAKQQQSQPKEDKPPKNM
jgi:hypothetical protein